MSDFLLELLRTNSFKLKNATEMVGFNVTGSLNCGMYAVGGLSGFAWCQNPVKLICLKQYHSSVSGAVHTLPICINLDGRCF